MSFFHKSTPLVAAAMMLLDLTVKHWNTAVRLAREGRYHEASQAVKAAEEGVVMGRVARMETPGRR